MFCWKDCIHVFLLLSILCLLLLSMFVGVCVWSLFCYPVLYEFLVTVKAAP